MEEREEESVLPHWFRASFWGSLEWATCSQHLLKSLCVFWLEDSGLNERLVSRIWWLGYHIYIWAIDVWNCDILSSAFNLPLLHLVHFWNLFIFSFLRNNAHDSWGEACVITNPSMLVFAQSSTYEQYHRSDVVWTGTCFRLLVFGTGHWYQVPAIHSVKAVPPLKAHR